MRDHAMEPAWSSDKGRLSVWGQVLDARQAKAAVLPGHARQVRAMSAVGANTFLLHAHTVCCVSLLFSRTMLRERWLLPWHCGACECRRRLWQSD